MEFYMSLISTKYNNSVMTPIYQAENANTSVLKHKVQKAKNYIKEQYSRINDSKKLNKSVFLVKKNIKGINKTISRVLSKVFPKIGKDKQSLESLPLVKLKAMAGKNETAKQVYEGKLESMSIAKLLPLANNCPIAKKVCDKKSETLKYQLAQLPSEKLMQYAKKNKLARSIYYQRIPLETLKSEVNRDPIAKSVYNERVQRGNLKSSLESLPLDELKAKANDNKTAKGVYERKLESMSITQLLPLAKQCPLAKKICDKKSMVMKYRLAQMPRKELLQHAKKSKLAKSMYYQRIPLNILKKQVNRDPLAKSVYRERLQLELLKSRGDKSLKGRDELNKELDKLPLYLLAERIEGSGSATKFFIEKLKKTSTDELALLSKTSKLAYGFYTERLSKLPNHELKKLIVEGSGVAFLLYQKRMAETHIAT